MIKGKTALVTGSTSGIGAGIAEKLASEGANIIITGLSTDESETQGFLKKLEGHGIKAHYLNINLLDTTGPTDLISQAEKVTGKIDILVNNAGAQFVAPITEFPIEKWDFILELNLSVPFKLIQAVLPIMRKNNFGRIINIASAHGLVASEGKTAYVAAKHGLVGLTKVVGLETAKENITVNAICPGWVLTPLVQEQIDQIAVENNLSNDEASRKLLSEKQPSEAFATPAQIGALTAFLASEDAAQITASVQSIDGGWTAR